MRSIVSRSTAQGVAFVSITVTMLACAPDKAEPRKPSPTSPPTGTTLTATLPPADAPRTTKPGPEPVKQGTSESDQSQTPLAEPTLVDAQATEADLLEPLLQDDGPLVIRRLITAPAVEQREPVAPSATFAPGQKIYAFLDVANESEEEKALTVNFIGPDGQVRGGVELEIPPRTSRWRTWAFTKRAEAEGSWKVEVRDSDGYLLGALPFELGHGC